MSLNYYEIWKKDSKTSEAHKIWPKYDTCGSLQRAEYALKNEVNKGGCYQLRTAKRINNGWNEYCVLREVKSGWSCLII